MLKKTLTTLVIAGLTGAAGLAFGLESAAATPLAGYTGMAKASDSYIQPVRWVYVEGRHGARYRYKHGGYRYYYGGYWYARPWWSLGVVGPGPVVVYNPTLYGPRYAYRRAGYGHYYNGYWYRRRWW